MAKQRILRFVSFLDIGLNIVLFGNVYRYKDNIHI